MTTKQHEPVISLKAVGILALISLSFIGWGFAQSKAQVVLETKVEAQREDIAEILSEIKLIRTDINQIRLSQ